MFTRISIRIAMIAAAAIAASPALATPPAATGDYHYDLGDYSATHVDQTGTGLGSYGATAGKAKTTVAFSLSPYVVVNIRSSNGNPSSVADATGTLTYGYAASFTAATGLTLATNAISVRARTNLTATYNADASAWVGDTFLSCSGNAPELSNGCGHSDFTTLTTPGAVTSVDLGNGLSRYTYTDLLALSGTASAFENYNFIITPNLKAVASAYVDPLISLDPAYLALVGGYDPDIQLSFGAVNALGPIDPPVAGVPEPAVWGLMLAGFGWTGASLRRRRTVVAA